MITQFVKALISNCIECLENRFFNIADLSYVKPGLTTSKGYPFAEIIMFLILKMYLDNNLLHMTINLLKYML